VRPNEFGRHLGAIEDLTMAAKKLSVGKAALAFALPSTDGSTFKLKDAAGKSLVIYFYPKDNTPGCTQEGADFAALAPAFKKARTVIVGISGDSLAAHERFKAKMKFPFELLADEDRAVCKLYDVIQEKSLYGRKFMGIERSTFLLDAQGVLRHEWRKVKVKGHAAEVLAASQAL
jgi:peroxiredoxin Q/BCP